MKFNLRVSLSLTEFDFVEGFAVHCFLFRVTQCKLRVTPW